MDVLLDTAGPAYPLLLGLLALSAILAGVSAVLRNRLSARVRDVAELTRTLEQERAALKEEREQRTDLAAKLSAETTRAERLPGLERELSAERTARYEAQQANTRLETEMDALKRANEEKLAELRDIRKQLEEKFTSLAGTALEDNSKRFLNLVSERFEKHKETAEKELNTRQEAIGNLVKPLQDRLLKFDERMGEIEKARNEAYGAIRTQVEQLTLGQTTLNAETRKLVQALRAPKTRGRWGEMQLRQVFEMAGMTEEVDFLTETSMETDEGRRRPDAQVRIPGGKSIIVDAKTPLDAYLDALEAETADMREAHITRHARQVREHIKVLASKAYQDQLDTTPDFVVMFIPGETFVSAACEADPGLLEFGFEKRVLIATPTTLMALIKAIAYGWQQEKMAENAAEVQRVAREIYDRLGTFASHLDKVGRSLRTSVDAYNKSVGSLEGRVLPSARKFESLGVVGPNDSLDQLAQVEVEPRALSAREFVPGSSG
ncbi:DNA recombination protein RmuC [Roseivivax sediminis]|uniref:DNA recombination protein RmuC homolog n=1 Tax=Roseivivax sediminis TaxID=936889 RepID=A0A1I1ZZZ0_9RHOB|nr:DNA recombination protein RmuC [Roseivivax sediminis]SFE37191.1 DNA recombination protein RmuC [Roseivivax sediminis]